MRVEKMAGSEPTARIECICTISIEWAPLGLRQKQNCNSGGHSLFGRLANGLLNGTRHVCNCIVFVWGVGAGG